MQIPAAAAVKCDQCPIRHRAVCAHCDDDELARLEDMKYYKTYPAGTPIFWRGDAFVFVASVVQGIASLSKTLEDGRTQMVGLLLPSRVLRVLELLLRHIDCVDALIADSHSLALGASPR